MKSIWGPGGAFFWRWWDDFLGLSIRVVEEQSAIVLLVRKVFDSIVDIFLKEVQFSSGSGVPDSKLNQVLMTFLSGIVIRKHVYVAAKIGWDNGIRVDTRPGVFSSSLHSSRYGRIRSDEIYRDFCCAGLTWNIFITYSYYSSNNECGAEDTFSEFIRSSLYLAIIYLAIVRILKNLL